MRFLPSRNDWKFNLLVLWVIQFIALAGVSISHPFIPLFIEKDIGVKDENSVKLYAGLLQATFFICSALMAPIWGTWADQKGRRPMVIRALIGSGIGIMLMSYAQTLPQLFVIRMLQGITGGMVSATAALVASSVPRERMGYSLGLMQTSLTSAHFVGPIIGGFVSDHIGYRFSFMLGGIVCFLCAIVVWGVVTEEFKGVPAKDRLRFRDNIDLFRENSILRYAAFAMFLSQVAMMIINPILPLFVKSLLPKNYGRVSTVVGFINGIPALTGFLAAPFWGRAGDRRGHARVLGYALFGSGVVYAPQAVAGSIAILGFWRAIVGIFNSGISPAAQSIAGNAAESNRTGAAISLLTSARMFGGFVGPVIGGIVATYLGWWEVFVFTALLQMAASSIVFKRLQFSDDTLRAARRI